MNKNIRRRLLSSKKRECLLTGESHLRSRLISIKKLLNIIKKLRTPITGCAWDLKQSNLTLKNSLIEESYEAAQAIEEYNNNSIKEELGDLLFVVLMHIHVAEQNSIAEFPEIINSISDKLVRRHPHIFAGLSVTSSDEILRNWEKIKRSEKKNKDTGSVLNDIPRAMPSLLRINRMLSKLNRLGELHIKPSEINENLKKNLDVLTDKKKTSSKNKMNEALINLIYSISVISFQNGIDLEDEFQKRITDIIKSNGKQTL
ncbi:MazG family protein [Candidatus Dependentiae bacterium]|nr:MazG family protein [Candidatus Dependentiae bacterium]